MRVNKSAFLTRGLSSLLECELESLSGLEFSGFSMQPFLGLVVSEFSVNILAVPAQGSGNCRAVKVLVVQAHGGVSINCPAKLPGNHEGVKLAICQGQIIGYQRDCCQHAGVPCTIPKKSSSCVVITAAHTVKQSSGLNILPVRMPVLSAQFWEINNSGLIFKL